MVGGYASYPAEPALEIDQKFDGNSHSVKRDETSRWDDSTGGDHVEEENAVTYSVRSSVLGGAVIAEVKPDGTRKQGNIYADGQRIAQHTSGYGLLILEVNPLTGARYRSNSSGYGYRDEFDPKGANTGTEDPWLTVLEPAFHDIVQEQPFLEMGGNPFDPHSGCELNGIGWDCNDLQRRGEEGNVDVQVMNNMNGFLGNGFYTVPWSDVFWSHGGASVANGSSGEPVTWARFDVATGPRRTQALQKPPPPTCVYNINLSLDDMPKEWRDTDTEKMVWDPLEEKEVKEYGYVRLLKNAIAKYYEDVGVKIVWNNKAAANVKSNGSVTLKFKGSFNKALTTTGILGKRTLEYYSPITDTVTVDISRTGSAVPWVAEAAAHGVGHEFLDDYPGNKDNHSEGLMLPETGETMLGLSEAQGKFLREQCLKK